MTSKFLNSSGMLVIVYHLDDLLRQLGNPGRFHILIGFLLCFNYIHVALNHVVMAFWGSRVDALCYPQKLGRVYTVNGKNLTILQIESRECDVTIYLQNNTNITLKCGKSDYLYKRKPSETTIATEWDLVCDDAIYVSMAITIYFFGVMVGSLFFGYFCDLIGRRPVMLITLYVPLAVGVGVCFVPSFTLFVILRFCLGAFIQGLHMSSYVLVTEMFLPKYRVFAAAIAQCFWGFAIILLGVLAYLISDWRYMQMAITIPNFMAVSYIFIIPESLRWLSMKGKVDILKKTVIKIARFNMCPIPEKELNSLRQTALRRRMEPEEKCTMLDLLKTPELRKRTVIMFFCWFTVASGYYGLMFKLTHISGNKYINFIIGACLEMVSYAMSGIVMTRIGRQRSMITYGFIGAVACFIAGSISPATASTGITLETAMVITAKFCLAGMFSVVYLYTTELYPTVIRNIGMGCCAFWTRLGGVVAPQINLLGNRNAASIPVLIYGTLNFITGLLMFLLPETEGLEMPDTIEQIEKRKFKKTNVLQKK